MKKMIYTREAVAGGSRMGPSEAAAPEITDEDRSKDAFFVQIAEIAEAMIARHGKEFAMGTLVLSARFIAEGKPLIKRSNGAGDEQRIA